LKIQTFLRKAIINSSYQPLSLSANRRPEGPLSTQKFDLNLLKQNCHLFSNKQWLFHPSLESCVLHKSPSKVTCNCEAISHILSILSERRGRYVWKKLVECTE
jgi:hypothetical protein